MSLRVPQMDLRAPRGAVVLVVMAQREAKAVRLMSRILVEVVAVLLLALAGMVRARVNGRLIRVEHRASKDTHWVLIVLWKAVARLVIRTLLERI